MGQGNRDGAVVLEAATDALADALQPEQAARGEAAHRDDQARPDEAPLPFAPEGAELLLTRRGRAVAAAAACLAGVAPSDGGAVERRVELVLVELEPAAQSTARAAAPRQALHAFLHSRRLPEHVGALPLVRLDDRERLQRVAGLDAGAADAVVALKRGQRSVARAAPRQERTATNQRP